MGRCCMFTHSAANYSALPLKTTNVQPMVTLLLVPVRSMYITSNSPVMKHLINEFQTEQI